MTEAKPSARQFWRNVLIAIPIGSFGGAFAGIVIYEGTTVPALVRLYVFHVPLQWSVTDILFGAFLWWPAFVGGMIGLITFPIAYAWVARTNNVTSIVAAGLVATILGAWIGWGSISVLTNFEFAHASKIPISLEYGALIAVHAFLALLPVIAMFCACAWVAARERRKAAG